MSADVAGGGASPWRLDYSFSPAEVRSLAKFLRKYQEALPDALSRFAGQVEQVVYQSLSIDEAEIFYS